MGFFRSLEARDPSVVLIGALRQSAEDEDLSAETRPKARKFGLGRFGSVPGRARACEGRTSSDFYAIALYSPLRNLVTSGFRQLLLSISLSAVTEEV